MKLRILSDLHVEFFPFDAPQVEADAVILAGDIGVRMQGLDWAHAQFHASGVPVLYVPGNHEFYHDDIEQWHAAAATRSAQYGIVLGTMGSFRLEKEGEQPVRVLGTTLWTDFALFEDWTVEQAGRRVQMALADYSAIRYRGANLRWPDTLEFHKRELTWLVDAAKQARAAGEKVVVVTHHAPSLHSALAVYQSDPVTAGFASNLESLVAKYVDVFVHGHMHNSSNYYLGPCRVIANPRGYPMQRWNPNTRFENQQFNPTLVVEV
ncbi:TPA: metallophosphoesterase [Burkholderia vietnamiensis]|nr:metallophosphoesterase [Burkholderia vietnamiensis]